MKLYKDSVEDKIKENVAIGGQEWDSVTRAEFSSNPAVQEGTCKLTCNININLYTKKKKQNKNKQTIFNAMGFTLHRKVWMTLHFDPEKMQTSTQLKQTKNDTPNINSLNFNRPAIPLHFQLSLVFLSTYV